MSRWAGKYVIGLTGNIAVGKSVVRKMLEHLGAYGIDADALSHRAMAKGAPAYPLITKAFGDWIQRLYFPFIKYTFVSPSARISAPSFIAGR